MLMVTTLDVVGCDACGTRAIGHGRRGVRVGNLPIRDHRVVLVRRKRLWRCPDPDCSVKTWSEETDAIAPRAVLTEGAEIGRHLGRDGNSWWVTPQPSGNTVIRGPDPPQVPVKVLSRAQPRSGDRLACIDLRWSRTLAVRYDIITGCS